MDCQYAVPYEPLTETKVGIELARVRTPAAAVAFVQRFGLLRSAPADLALEHPKRRPAQARERVSSFIAAADDLRRIIKTAGDVRLAVKGDAVALAQMRKEWSYGQHRDDRTLLIAASDWAAMGLLDGLCESEAWPYVYDRAQIGEPVEPGSFRIGILPETLLGACYLTVAFALADKEPLEVCPECGDPFIATDARQKFCRPACSNKARFRRFKNNQAQHPKRSHGKTTRTR